MANRFDWNALDEKIKLVLQENADLNNRSKALTALAIATILDVDIEEAIDAVTDAGNDRGVDGLFIDDRESRNDIHLVQTKCVGKFENSKKNFPGAEVDKIVSFISDLLSEDTEALKSSNPQLKRKIADALEMQKRSGATVTVHFVGNMGSLVTAEMDRIRAVFAKYSAVQFEMHNLDALSDFFLSKKSPNLTRKVTALDKNHFSRTDLNLRGMVCTVSALDIVDAIRSEDNENEVEISIFDQNVRVFLKRRNRVNRRIFESALAEDNHMFWYQNNGITMTCDKFEMAPAQRSPEITLINVQIVNGGQTSNCLFEASRKGRDKIEDVLLLVRIIETTSEEVKLSIAESTNSQTPINVRDLRANDRQQRQLEESFSDLGFFYERKAMQFQGMPKEKRIDALAAGQAYLAYGLGMPEVAKKDRGRVFGDLYDTVFTDDINAAKLLAVHQLAAEIAILKSVVRTKIRNKKRLAKGEMSLIDGAFHVLFAVRQILMRDDKQIWSIDDAKAAITEATKIVGDLYVVAQKKDVNFSSNRFFKDAVTKDIVIRKVG